MKRCSLVGVAQSAPHGERGYILLTLLLVSAVLIIATAVIVPAVTFDIKREKEAEMIHRGVQYSRAIRAFTRATSRYPLRLEELQNTNGQRFIRKLYKDPVTGDDFRLLHPLDIRSTAPIANLNPANDQGDADSASSTVGGDPATASTAPNPKAKSSFNSADPNVPSTGGIIVGVASKSKANTIREFDGKNHYKDWLFFYDPGNERGLRANGPTSLTNPASPPFNRTNPALTSSGQ